MKISTALGIALGACGLLSMLQCGGDDDDTSAAPCSLEQPTSCGPGKLCKQAETGVACVPGCLHDVAGTCATGQICEDVEGAEPLCFTPVTVRGKVIDALTLAPLGGARVTARDEAGAVTSSVATSGADGAYEIALSAKRKPDGTPLPTLYTLRGDARAYATFPGGIRPALPFDLATARAPAAAGGPYVYEDATTTLGLLPLPSAAGLGTVRGFVRGDRPGGTLVTVGNVSGVAGVDGEFVAFNAPAGRATVRGYRGGVQLSAPEVEVPADGEVAGVELTPRADVPLATLRGNINFANAPGGSKTSVVLVTEGSFNAALETGEVPPGLRVDDVAGAFSMAGVPDGAYVVLASLDNDGLVRDPDPNIAGTQVVHVTVANGVPSQADVSFKVTGALTVRSPGAETPETITLPMTAVWADDSSEESYALKIFDAFGTLVWESPDLDAVKGSADVQVAYGGPALVPGMIYQFRATSYRRGGPISRTEELRGVFSPR
jgi:hypothetical protein